MFFCQLTGVDPFAYLKDVHTRISTHQADRIEELIPREWKKRFGPTDLTAAAARA